VTPTLRVRFVYDMSQYGSKGPLVGSITIVVGLEDVEKCQKECSERMSKRLIPSVGNRGNYCHHLYSCGGNILTDEFRIIYCISSQSNKLAVNCENVVQCPPTRSLRLPDSSPSVTLLDTPYPLARVERHANVEDPECARIPLWHRRS
jgi:hypothetical protein